MLAVWALGTPEHHVPNTQGLGEVLRAVRGPAVVRGMWLVTLPALAFGTLYVVGSLRLDHLGAGTAAVAATFLVAAGSEALVSPLVGRLSDRRGRLLPVRLGLSASAVVFVVITLPGAPLPFAAGVVLLGATLGTFWAPAMAMLSDAAEATGLDQAYAFALVNVAWAIGQVGGSLSGGALAEATSDAVPFLLVAAVCGGTLLGLTARRSPATVLEPLAPVSGDAPI